MVLDAEEHDRVVALTSHLPQLASTALAATVAERMGASPRWRMAGPGLADMTRLALGSYDLWRDILATNTEHIERALAVYIQKLEHMRENLRTRQLQEEFERGAAWRAACGRRHLQESCRGPHDGPLAAHEEPGMPGPYGAELG